MRQWADHQDLDTRYAIYFGILELAFLLVRKIEKSLAGSSSVDR
jgi:hypothetical protein